MGAIATAGAEYKIKKAEVNANRKIQAASNERQGAESELARFSASLGNRRLMDATGDRINDIAENTGRSLDAAAYGTLGERVAAAEELGAHVSMAAAAGVGGSSNEQYMATLRLSQSMQEEQNSRSVNSENLDAAKSRGIQLTDGIAGLDNNVYAANLSLKEYAEPKKMSTFTKIAGTVATAAATYFGGPQAGQAVQDAMMADYAASNGDMARANQYLGSAYKGAKGGLGTFRATKGKGWGSTIKI